MFGGVVEAVPTEAEYYTRVPAHPWNDFYWGGPQVFESGNGRQLENGDMTVLYLLCQICVYKAHIFFCEGISTILLGGLELLLGNAP